MVHCTLMSHFYSWKKGALPLKYRFKLSPPNENGAELFSMIGQSREIMRALNMEGLVRLEYWLKRFRPIKHCAVMQQCAVCMVWCEGGDCVVRANHNQTLSVATITK